MNIFDTVYEGKPPHYIPGERHMVLSDLINELGLKTGVEIGTERGVFAKNLINRCKGFKLYCVDPWKAYSTYKEHISQDKLDLFYEETKKRLENRNVQIIRSFSEDAHKLFEDGSLDFIYIDGNHEYFHIVEDLKNWVPKIRKGGIVSGHDFRRNSSQYVNDTKDVIPGYVFAKKISPWFIINDPHEADSWFWEAK